ncbi:MAG: hypothetical protein UZ22_OP11002000509 [Microgenomates bacterium OLB23]|nr:MAG: hypothetical protein UZ22_OP11002000509 [Microgenomates bacterium OLB23]
MSASMLGDMARILRLQFARSHPDECHARAFREGTLPEPTQQWVLEHLLYCPRCTEKYFWLSIRAWAQQGM